MTVTASSFLLGRRELPKIGRFLGLYSGRSVGAILRAKKEFFDATKDNDLVKVRVQPFSLSYLFISRLCNFILFLPASTRVPARHRGAQRDPLRAHDRRQHASPPAALRSAVICP